MSTFALCSILLLSIFSVPISCVAATPNCCSLSETQLKALHSNPSCPIGSSTFSSLEELNAKCDECPGGTCRVDLDCYCPTDFLTSDSQQQLCVYSFGENWPKSIDKEDTTYRSCVKDPSSTTTDENCCSLTTSQLQSRVGTSNLCPTGSTSTFSFVKDLAEKCDRCPFGTCRVGEECYCPKDFLGSDSQQELCRSSFGEKWDESVGLEDRHWRSCVRPSPSESFTFDSCCLLSVEQLDVRIGTSNLCPKFSTSSFGYVKDLDVRCDPCPFGTCRAGSSCYCPQDFLNSDAQKELCRESFGEVHPDSIGLPDILCPSNPVPKVISAAPKPRKTPTPAKNQSSGPTPSKAPNKPSSTTSSSTSNPPNQPSSDSETPSDSTTLDSSQAASSVQAGKESEDSEDSKLTTAEIVGIVIGSVTGIISALGVLAAWFRKRSTR